MEARIRAWRRIPRWRFKCRLSCPRWRPCRSVSTETVSCHPRSGSPWAEAVSRDGSYRIISQITHSHLAVDPARLVFIDETSANTKMVRLSGRCARGERLVSHVPQGHWKTITFVAALRRHGIGTTLTQVLALSPMQTAASRRSPNMPVSVLLRLRRIGPTLGLTTSAYRSYFMSANPIEPVDKSTRQRRIGACSGSHCLEPMASYFVWYWCRHRTWQRL
jgi:hypothetical protein